MLICDLPPCPVVIEVAGVVEENLLWPKEKNVLIVTFLDGDNQQQQFVAEVASEWNGHGIDFVFPGFHIGGIDIFLPAIYGNGDNIQISETVASDIRVTFEAGGSWSYVGIAGQHRQADEATLSLYRNELNRHVILHEFGHALGLLHEHKHPERTIIFDYNKAIAYYSKYHKYSPEQTKYYMLDVYSSDWLIAKPYDILSVMHYYIPGQILINHEGIPAQEKLSNGDLSFIEFLYAKEN